MDRFTRLDLLSTTPYEIAGNPLTRGSRITDHRFHRRRGIDSLLEARVLAYERIIIASGDFSRRELLELKGELEAFLLHGYSCLKWMLFLCRFAKN